MSQTTLVKLIIIANCKVFFYFLACCNFANLRCQGYLYFCSRAKYFIVSYEVLTWVQCANVNLISKNIKMAHGNLRPKIELIRAFMPVLVTSNFDDDSIKNEWASMETPFSHYKSNSSEILCISSLHASMKRIGPNTTEKWWRHHFPHYNSMGAFCCHRNHSFDPICPKTLSSLSPTPMMLHIKFYQDWPTAFRDIQVQKCEIFVTQGQVTPKWVVWFGPKSNST